MYPVHEDDLEIQDKEKERKWLAEADYYSRKAHYKRYYNGRIPSSEEDRNAMIDDER